MESFNFQQKIKVKVEKNNSILKCEILQRSITSLFRFIELCIFFFIISRFYTQLLQPVEYLKGLCITLISPFFVFLLGNAIVIILFLLKSCQSSTKAHFYHDVAKVNFYNKASCISSSRQVKKNMYRSKSEKSMNKLSHEEVITNNNRVLRRSATVACRRYGEKPAAEMTGQEFRRTVEAFIDRQQRFLREEELSADVSIEA